MNEELNYLSSLKESKSDLKKEIFSLLHMCTAAHHNNILHSSKKRERGIQHQRNTGIKPFIGTKHYFVVMLVSDWVLHATNGNSWFAQQPSKETSEFQDSVSAENFCYT